MINNGRFITIINGPNLNLLGTREVAIYGSKTLADCQQEWHHHALNHKVDLTCYQSNHEGELIDAVQQASTKAHSIGLIINGAGYSHTSIALADALRACPLIKVEVHLSNIFAREAYRHHSYLGPVCDASLCGMAEYGYLAAIDYIMNRIKNEEHRRASTTN